MYEGVKSLSPTPSAPQCRYLDGFLVVADELGVDIQVEQEGDQELPEPCAGLHHHLVEPGTEHLVQHQQTLTVDKQAKNNRHVEINIRDYMQKLNNK